MVERTSAQGLDEFIGTCNKVERIEGTYGPEMHLLVEPEDKSLTEGSKTGCFHVFLRITPKSTEISVPEGSSIDQFLKEVESVLKEAKKQDTIIGALETLKGKKILYRKKVIGRKFEGKEARETWVPVALK